MKTQFSVWSGQVWKSISGVPGDAMCYLVSSMHDTVHGRHHYPCFTPEGKRLGQVMGISQDHMTLKCQGHVSNLFFRAALLILPLHFVASQAHVSSSRLPWRGKMLLWLQTHHAAAKPSGAYPMQTVMDTDSCLLGLPSGSDGKESAHSVGDPGSSWVGKIPWRRDWQPSPVFLPGESHGQRSLAGYSPWGLRIGHN